MPIVTVDWWAENSEDSRRRLVADITTAVVRASGCAPDSVTVIVRDVPRDHWARGGVLAHERPAARGRGG